MEVKTKEEFRDDCKKKGKALFIIGLIIAGFWLILAILGFVGALPMYTTPSDSSSGASVIESVEKVRMSNGEAGGVMILPTVIGVVVALVGRKLLSKAKDANLEKAYQDYQAQCEAKGEVKADFECNKTIKISEYEKAWIHTENKLIQFLIRATTETEKDDPSAIEVGRLEKTIIYKTKVFDIGKIESCEVIRSKANVTTSNYGSSSGESTDYTVSYFELQLRIHDIDCPFLCVSFGKNGVTATLLQETINMLRA